MNESNKIMIIRIVDPVFSGAFHWFLKVQMPFPSKLQVGYYVYLFIYCDIQPTDYVILTPVISNVNSTIS